MKAQFLDIYPDAYLLRVSRWDGLLLRLDDMGDWRARYLAPEAHCSWSWVDADIARKRAPFFDKETR